MKTDMLRLPITRWDRRCFGCVVGALHKMTFTDPTSCAGEGSAKKKNLFSSGPACAGGHTGGTLEDMHAPHPFLVILALFGLSLPCFIRWNTLMHPLPDARGVFWARIWLTVGVIWVGAAGEVALFHFGPEFFSRLPVSAYLIALVGWGLLWWMAVDRPVAPRPEVQPTRQYDHARLDGPIRWNFFGFLACNANGDIVHVASFQITGQHAGEKEVQIQEAHLISGTTGAKIPIKIRTTSGYVCSNESNPLPPDAMVDMRAWFYDPNRERNPNKPEGMPEEEFLNKWGSLTFVIVIDGKSERHPFTSSEVVAEISRVKPVKTVRPMATKRET